MDPKSCLNGGVAAPRHPSVERNICHCSRPERGSKRHVDSRSSFGSVFSNQPLCERLFDPLLLAYKSRLKTLNSYSALRSKCSPFPLEERRWESANFASVCTYTAKSEVKLQLERTKFRNTTKAAGVKFPLQLLNTGHLTCRDTSQLIRQLLLVALFLAIGFLPSVQCRSSSSFFNSKFQTSYDLWEHNLNLEEKGNYFLQWTAAEDRILFRVTAHTTGYIGFGLSSKPYMNGADIVVGWVHSGKAYLQDRHGKGNQSPSVDRQQDWDLIGGYENDTHTVLIMSRPYVTCDPNDHPISNDTVRLLWAYHPDDPVDPENPRPRLHYHGSLRRGSTTLFLLQRPPKEQKETAPPLGYPKLHLHNDGFQGLDPPVMSWSLIGPPAAIASTSDSVHWCRLFKRPQLSRKHHVVKYEPVFFGDNRPFIHHMMVYECIPLSKDDEDLLHGIAGGNGSYCHDRDMSQFLSACNHVVAAWSYGSGGVSLPAEAGYPLSPEGPTFFMLETHYDIPQEEALLDASGIRLLHTPILRNFDAGVLSVGLDPNWKHLIPPRQPTVVSEGHCVKECLGAALPSSGINVFGVIFHTHLLGRRVRLRHIRRDTEFEPLAMDNNHDFSYQDYRALKESRKILPGDHLIGECVYNSEERSSITLGGFKTRDEMCLTFLFYWPRVELSLCHSKPSLNTVLQSLGIEELSDEATPITIKSPKELAGKTLKWRLQNYDWGNQFDHFQAATSEGTFNPLCLNKGQRLTPEMDDVDYSFPNISKEWSLHPICEKEKKKARKRKKKEKESRSSAADQGQPPQSLDDDDLMIDDGAASYKPIEMVDVDPQRTFDVFMPVIGGATGEQTSPENPPGMGTPNFGNDGRITTLTDSDYDRMEEVLKELDEVEKELENELHQHYHHNNNKNNVPDTYQERTGSRSTSRASYSSNSVHSWFSIQCLLVTFFHSLIWWRTVYLVHST